MQSCQFITAITALACVIFECVPEEDIPLLAASLTQLGDTLATMSAHKERASQTDDKNSQTDDKNSQTDDKNSQTDDKNSQTDDKNSQS